MKAEDVKKLIGKCISWHSQNNPEDEQYGVVLATSQDHQWLFIKMLSDYRKSDWISMVRVDDMVNITEI